MLAVYCPYTAECLRATACKISSVLEKIVFKLPDTFQMEELCFRKENQAVRTG